MSDLKMFYNMFRIVFFKFLSIILMFHGIGMFFTKEISYEVISLLCVTVGWLIFGMKMEE